MLNLPVSVSLLSFSFLLTVLEFWNELFLSKLINVDSCDFVVQASEDCPDSTDDFYFCIFYRIPKVRKFLKLR